MVCTMWNFEGDAVKVWRADSRVGKRERRAERRVDMSDMVVVEMGWLGELGRRDAWGRKLSQVGRCGGTCMSRV